MTDLLHEVRNHRIIVALRGAAPEAMASIARALYNGGIRMIEVTFEQTAPDTIQKTASSIEAVRNEVGDAVLVGAGTTLTPEQAKAAVAAGASYLLSPHFDPAVVESARALGAGVIPGCFSPSEVVAAWHAGASLIKLFPAETGGISYIKALGAPLGHIPLLPMGGVSLENINDFLSLPNVAGVGIGSAIAKKSLIAAGDFEGLQALAARYVKKLNN